MSALGYYLLVALGVSLLDAYVGWVRDEVGQWERHPLAAPWPLYKRLVVATLFSPIKAPIVVVQVALFVVLAVLAWSLRGGRR